MQQIKQVNSDRKRASFNVLRRDGHQPVNVTAGCLDVVLLPLHGIKSCGVDQTLFDGVLEYALSLAARASADRFCVPRHEDRGGKRFAVWSLRFMITVALAPSGLSFGCISPIKSNAVGLEFDRARAVIAVNQWDWHWTVWSVSNSGQPLEPERQTHVGIVDRPALESRRT